MSRPATSPVASPGRQPVSQTESIKELASTGLRLAAHQHEDITAAPSAVVLNTFPISTCCILRRVQRSILLRTRPIEINIYFCTGFCPQGLPSGFAAAS